MPTVPPLPMSVAQDMLFAPNDAAYNIGSDIHTACCLDKTPDASSEAYTKLIWKEYDDIINLPQPPIEEAERTSLFPLFVLLLSPEQCFPGKVAETSAETISMIKKRGPVYLRTLFELASGKSPNTPGADIEETVLGGNDLIEALQRLAEQSDAYCAKHKKGNEHFAAVAESLQDFVSGLDEFNTKLTDSILYYKAELGPDWAPRR